MYVYDDHSDIMKYSQFKESVDENYWTMESDEDFGLKIGNSTPIGFPGKFKFYKIVEFLITKFFFSILGKQCKCCRS